MTMDSALLHQQILKENLKKNPQVLRPKAIIFDLDDTLLDTSHLLLPVAGTEEYFRLIKKPLPALPGAIENLETLTQRGYQLFLVTQGEEDVQKQKVESLGISRFFKMMWFVKSRGATFSVEGPKYDAFLQLIKNFEIPAAEVLSIGNRPEFDLRPVKSLSGSTCWFRHGEHSKNLTTHPWDQPDFTASHHSELLSACNLI